VVAEIPGAGNEGGMMEERQVEPPEPLKRLQEGFGQAVRMPVSFATGRFVFRSEEYSGPFLATVLPRGTQTGRDRLAIYNEQYWFRLFTILQDDFPLLAATLGMWRFNQLACAYLDRHPSRAPFLDRLADHFEAFIRSGAHHASPLHVQIAALECALIKTFQAPEPVHFQADRFLEQAPMLGADSVLEFPSGFSLFEEDWNLMENRARVVASDFAVPEGSGNPYQPEPELRKGYWVIFRKEGRVDWKETDRTQFRLLSELARGRPLGEACEGVVAGLDEEALARLPSDLPRWFAEWTASGWFTTPETKS
jgi:hypothetical protein